MLIPNDRTHGIPTFKTPPPSTSLSPPDPNNPRTPKSQLPPPPIPSSTSTPPPRPLYKALNRENQTLTLGRLPLMLLMVEGRLLNTTLVRQACRQQRRPGRLLVSRPQGWGLRRSSSSSNRGWRRRRRCRLLRSRRVGIWEGSKGLEE